MTDVTGTELNDVIDVGSASEGVIPETGTSDGNDVVDGLGGDDWIFAGGGRDVLHGGVGNDVLGGGDDDDMLEGGDGNDVLLGGEGRDDLDGQGGDDSLFGGDDSDNLNGGAGRDVLFGGQGKDFLRGGEDNDALFGGADPDFLFGDSGNDLLNGGDGADGLNGDDGDDVLIGGGGEDTLEGGVGNDRLVSGGDNNNDFLVGGADNDIFAFSGTNGNDTIVDFTDGSDRIDFTAYDVSDVKDLDIIADGDNTIISGYAGFGDDITLWDVAPEDLSNDDFIFSSSIPPVISIAADDSADQNEGNEGTTEFTFTVTRSGDLSGESTVDVDFFPGDTEADDFVGGFPETQTIQFAANEDTKTVSIPVSGDLDVEDNETFALTLVNATNAVIDETANDAVGVIRNDDEPDLNVIDGTDGPDVLQGTDGNDAIRGFDENDILLGLGGNDIMDGGDDEDVILGGEGNDILIGGNNSDVLLGGAGNDALIGGDGEDVLRGDEGNDILTGGLRSDAFQFSGCFGNDVITDFDDNQDGVFFEGADSDNITAEVFVNGTLLTVESEETKGTVLLLGVTDVDGLEIG